MKLRKSILLLAALGLSAPVFAQSGTGGSAGIGAGSSNETAGSSNTNIKGQGSGSADLATGNRATGASSAATTGATGAAGAAGANIGATSTNEVSGSSTIPGVKPEGSGSTKPGTAKGMSDKDKTRSTAKSGTTDATGATGTSTGANVGATSTNETGASSSSVPGVKPEGSGAGTAGSQSSPKY